MEGYAVGLADPLDTPIGGQFDKNEVATTEAWLRVADHKGLGVNDLHGQVVSCTILRAGSRPDGLTAVV